MRARQARAKRVGTPYRAKTKDAQVRSTAKGADK